MKQERKCCKYCKRPFAGLYLHEQKCKIFHAYVEDGNKCLLCSKSTPFIFSHLQKEHAEHFNKKITDEVAKKIEVKECQVIIEPLKYVCLPCRKAFEYEYEMKMHNIKNHSVSEYRNEFRDIIKKALHDWKTLHKSVPDVPDPDPENIKTEETEIEIVDIASDSEFNQKIIEVTEESESEKNDNEYKGPEENLNHCSKIKFIRNVNSWTIETPRSKVKQDPSMITKLYKCPFCFGFLPNFQLAKNHVTSFHHISIEDLPKMGMKIDEVIPNF